MNHITIRATAAVLSIAVTFTLLKGVGIVADAELASSPSDTRMARAQPAASAQRAALQVATLHREATPR
jgi:hypothetical protein